MCKADEIERSTVHDTRSYNIHYPFHVNIFIKLKTRKLIIVLLCGVLSDFMYIKESNRKNTHRVLLIEFVWCFVVHCNCRPLHYDVLMATSSFTFTKVIFELRIAASNINEWVTIGFSILQVISTCCFLICYLTIWYLNSIKSKFNAWIHISHLSTDLDYVSLLVLRRYENSSKWLPFFWRYMTEI